MPRSFLWGAVFSVQMGYLKKNGDGSLVFSTVNPSDPEAEGNGLDTVFKSSFRCFLLVCDQVLILKLLLRSVKTGVKYEIGALSKRAGFERNIVVQIE